MMSSARANALRLAVDMNRIVIIDPQTDQVISHSGSSNQESSS